MKVSILGGGGFLGRKIAAKLAMDGALGGQTVSALTLFDVAEPPKPDASFPINSIGGDVVALPDDAIPAGTDVVFHLAAVVSAQAEADYDLGRRVNIRGTDAVIDRCRTLGTCPRVVFTSSVGELQRRPKFRSCRIIRARSRATAMARKRPPPSCFWRMLRAEASSTPSRYGFPRSSCGRGGQTRPPAPSSPASSASRFWGWIRNCLFRTTLPFGFAAHAARSTG